MRLQIQAIKNKVVIDSNCHKHKLEKIPDAISILKSKIETANYSKLPIEQFVDMNEAIQDMLIKGHKAEAGRYYMDQTGLSAEEAIEYLEYVEKKEENTKLS